MEMVNGYVFVDLTGENVYKKALGAISAKKPVLVKDYDQIYFADTITTKTVDDDLVVVITKGGKTITITDANSVSSEGIVDNPTMENIVDLNGNKRFVEGNCDTQTIEGVTYDYNKWSLSGTHLMIVLGGSVANGTSITASLIASITLPQWIVDKITPLVSTFIENKTISLRGSDLSTQTLSINLAKEGQLLTLRSGTLTLTADRVFRVQFDLLIDNE